MAFNLNSLDPTNSGSGGASSLGTYRTNDTKSEVLAPGYFNEAAGNLRWTKALLVAASGEVFIATVDVDLNDNTVTLAEFGVVDPDDILAALADPGNLPLNVGNSFMVTEDGPQKLIDYEGAGYVPLPIYPFPFGAPPVGTLELVSVSNDETFGPHFNKAGGLHTSGTSGPPPSNVFVRTTTGGRLSVGDVPADQTPTTNNSYAINYGTLRKWVQPLNGTHLPTNLRDYVFGMNRNSSVYTPSYMLLSVYTASPNEGEIARYGTGGRFRVAPAETTSDAVSLGQLNERLSAAQRAAIDALDAGTSTVEDVINALKAT